MDGAARLSQDPVDLVVSDVEMPGMDGFTLTRTLRRTRGWEDVPVVIMTSRGDPADQRAGLDAGASAYLLKSEFDQAELIDTVRRLLGR
jgi:CheY-like chemotaxis protein